MGDNTFRFSIEDHGEFGCDLDGAWADLSIKGPYETTKKGFVWRTTLAYVSDRKDLPLLYEALKYLKRKRVF